MKDYYAILGLGPDASLDSIKRAYRLKARAAHPDRFSHKGDSAEAEATAMMSELNEAYGVLSNEEQRKEYDIAWRALQAGEPIPEPKVPAAADVVPVVPTPRRERARPASDIATSVIREFAERLRKELIENKKAFQWKERKLDGFDWALEQGFFMDYICVASRTVAMADPETTQKYLQQVELAIQQTRHLMKNDYYLFLFPFQAMEEPDRVQSALQRFRPSGREVQLQIALMDITHGRSLMCGPRIRNERYHDLLKRMRLAR